MSSDVDFKSKKLYDQKCRIEENKLVASRVYAASYTYPGSLSPITSRCRITLVYEDLPNSFTVAGGTIEKWSDKGWQVIEEFFDTCVEIIDLEQGLEYLLSIFKSFILGLPISYAGKIEDDPPPGPDKRPEKNPKLRVLSFKDKVESFSSKNPPEKSDKPDSPDFDWI